MARNAKVLGKRIYENIAASEQALVKIPELKVYCIIVEILEFNLDMLPLLLRR